MTLEYERNIILYVAKVHNLSRDVIRSYNKNLKVVLLKDVYKKSKEDTDIAVDEILYVDFRKPHKIAKLMNQYQNRILAVTTNGDAGIQQLRLVIPHLPYLRTPTSMSLLWSTNKLKMRERFAISAKKHIPEFTQVKSQTPKELSRIISKIGFPMVIKPADLSSSLLVSACYHEEELCSVLRQTFSRIKQQYKSNARQQEPVILAESFIEGDLYSVDSYVDSRGKVTHCPLVRVLRGSDIGDDDFYNYVHMTPAGLRDKTEENAYKVAEIAIHALGLRSTTAHVELLKVDDEWKIVEVGPRMGGFRHVIYDLAYGINHILNDVLIRIPKSPNIKKSKHRHAAALKWFADKEGVITEMKGIKKVQQLKSFHDISINKQIGDKVKFSKNGGKSVFHIFFVNESRSKLLADIKRTEKLIEIKVR